MEATDLQVFTNGENLAVIKLHGCNFIMPPKIQFYRKYKPTSLVQQLKRNTTNMKIPLFFEAKIKFPFYYFLTDNKIL